MREITALGYSHFILPFMAGMTFVLGYCIISMVKVFIEITPADRRKFLLSLVNPRIMLKNIRDIFADCLLHVKLWKRNKLLGFMHSSIAFGWFMIILIGHIEVFIYTPDRVNRMWYPIFFRYFVAVADETMRGSLFFFLMDFFLLMILIGIILAMVKRVRSLMFGMRRTTRNTLLDTIAMLALWAIFPLRLLAEGFTADISGGSFLTKSLNSVLHNFISNAEINADPTWWAYSIALGVFMFLLPFTRYMHIPAEIMLIPMRNAGLKIRHARKGFSRLQVYSCPSCGVCIDACPMSVTKAHTKDATVYLNRQIKRRNGKRIEEISDKCLLCGKCSALCPVGVQGDKLRIAQRSVRKYGLEPHYDNIQLPSAAMSGEGEKVLYFAGCMSSVTPSIGKSLTAILEKAGVNYEQMDKDGGLCCGRPMWTAGRFDAAREMIARNKDIIEKSGADTLLVSCPICYRIFVERYRLENIRVVHHTVFIEELLRQGRISIGTDRKKYVFHDPCELGRGTGIYEQPRQVLRIAGELVEARKSGQQSICCGGSLGSLSLDFNRRKPIINSSIENLTAMSPDTIVTACPLCLNTFSRYSTTPVKDIAQVVADKL